MLDTCSPATVTVCKLAGCGFSSFKFSQLGSPVMALGQVQDAGQVIAWVEQRDQLRDGPTRCGTVGRSVTINGIWFVTSKT